MTPESTDRPLPEKVVWSGMTDPGRYRQNNEDAFLALVFNATQVQRLGKTGQERLEAGDFIFAVSDGMGGHLAGEFASRLAVEHITSTFPRFFRFGAIGPDAGGPEILGNLFTEIHRSIVHLGQAYEECRDMGATLTLAWLRPGRLHFCHIGDSRLYYLPRDGALKQISEDHSHVGWLLRNGKISETQARFHPARNRLSQALCASHGSIDPQLGTVLCEPGDRFVFCTDGLTEGLSNNGILHLLNDAPPSVAGLSPAEALVRESIAGSGRDNTTAVVVEVL